MYLYEDDDDVVANISSRMHESHHLTKTHKRNINAAQQQPHRQDGHCFLSVVNIISSKPHNGTILTLCNIASVLIDINIQ